MAVLKDVGAAKLLNWNDPEKPNRLLAITQFFINEEVETVSDLATWLSAAANIPRLKKQRGIRDKTADYFKILAGLQAVAVDRHLLNFLEEAGCPARDYTEAQEMIQAAAGQLSVPFAVLDHNIWLRMSRRKKCG
jgi:hypothetical protein